jgi:hypothetical protein
MSSQCEILAFLHSRGISSNPKALKGLGKLLTDAIAQLPAAPFLRDPRQELSGAEAESLEAGGFDLRAQDLGTEDPLLRSMAIFTAILEDALSVKEASRVLRVNESRIRQRLAIERSLYGVKIRSEWRIPRFQFEKEKPVPGIEGVFPALPDDLHPIAVYSWFTTPNPDLELDEGRRLSPREWLLLGNPTEAVVELAKDL